jgi:hypothetical protein
MASLKKAIEAKCKDCIYDQAIPASWVEQVEAYTSVKSCALWPVRPRTRETIDMEHKNNAASAAVVKN